MHVHDKELKGTHLLHFTAKNECFRVAMNEKRFDFFIAPRNR